jgi:hypothetical protein
MTRFDELSRFEAALSGTDAKELEWAVHFATHMLRHMKLKQGIEMWRKNKQRAENRYDDLRRVT